MIYTLAQAREAVKRFVDAGSCHVATIDARVNEALERLTDNVDFECMQATIRIATCKLSFSLPYNVEKLLFVDVNGTPAKIFGRAYQFMSSGTGDLDVRCGGSGFRDILDQGEFPLQFDIPKLIKHEDGTVVNVHREGMRLVALSTHAEDVGQVLKVRGFHGTGESIRTAGAAGEDIAIQRWVGGVEGQLQGHFGSDIKLSAHRFSEVTEVLKPPTKGYITLYATRASNTAPELTVFSFLAKYHPDQRIPQFRRYAITNTSGNAPSSVLALVKMRHIPLVEADDILPIDSLQALKLMVMAIREENLGNLQGAINFEGQAVGVMLKRERAHTQSDGMPTMLNVDYRCSLGRRMNRRGVIL